MQTLKTKLRDWLLHPKLDFHAIQVRGGAVLGYQGFTALVFCLAAAQDPRAVRETWLFRQGASIPILYSVWLGGGGSYKENQYNEVAWTLCFFAC